MANLLRVDWRDKSKYHKFPGIFMYKYDYILLP